MQADGPVPAIIVRLKPALDQIADHGNQLVQIAALGGHFRLVAGGDERILIPLNLKNEFILHLDSLAHAVHFTREKPKSQGDLTPNDSVEPRINTKEHESKGKRPGDGGGGK